MCGIFGYFDQDNNFLNNNNLENMGDVIKHRGPDGLGYYHDELNAVAIGNQRLAILDVENGQQPFFSKDKSIVVVQNGEIFNHVELSNDLKKKGHLFHTTCDTEVILRLYEEEGIGGISKLNGMFAIAIYDKNLRTLYLIRDRVGEKPLHYCNENGRILFGSEIKSILEASESFLPSFEAINQFLSFNYVPPPLTMFKNIYHVLPGTYLKITNNTFEEIEWFDLANTKTENRNESDWIEEFNSILDDAVKIRLRSDVPFGAFLSGGVDSSSVVGLMSKHLEEKVNTFNIGFNDKRYDESPFALDAAIRFNTNHISEKVEADMTSLWPMATYYCDQPHGDISFLPTYRVAELASKKVKMVLTGDGADELYAGYDKYKDFFNNKSLDLTRSNFESLYHNNISLFQKDDRKKLFSKSSLKKIENIDTFNVTKALFNEASNMDRINQALYIDTKLLLPGNNLVKPDRMGMAVSIENRAPFLDYRMITFSFSMPGNLKLKDGETKYIYKKAVEPLIGKDLAYRKKQMFTVPVGNWFKKELKEMCEDLLMSDKTINRGIFNYDYIAEIFYNHVKGLQNNTREIRALMALEIWFRKFFD